MPISPASRPGLNVSSTKPLAVCLLLLGLAGPATLAPGDALGQAPLPPRLSVDRAFSPPFGVARDSSAGLVADTPHGVAVDGERIYTVGQSGGDVVIIARRADGTYDSGFDGDGRRDLPLGAGSDAGYAVAVLPDHRLRVLASTVVGPSSATHRDVALIGLNPNGSDDLSFGGGDGLVDGRVSFPVGPSDDVPNRMAVDAAGRLAITGSTEDAAGREDTFVALRERDGSPVPGLDGDGLTGFNSNGLRVIKRAEGTLDDRGVDVAFRPGGGLVALLHVTHPDTNVGNVAVMRALRENGTDDPGFSFDGDLVLDVGQTNAFAGGLLIHGGRLWTTGNTRVGQDTDAFLARVEADGGQVQFRRFDMRGSQIASDQVVPSTGVDLDVLSGTLVVVGYTSFNSRLLWSAAAFNNFEGDLAQAGYGDLVIPTTEEFARLVDVAAGSGFLAATGPLIGFNPFDTSFGTIRLLVNAASPLVVDADSPPDRRCDLGIDVPTPLELVFGGDRPAPVTVRVSNHGTGQCTGDISISQGYELRLGSRAGPIATGVLLPGASYLTQGAQVAYGGPRRRSDVIALRVSAAGDADQRNNVHPLRAVFSYCDLRLSRVGASGLVPNEGSRRFEFLLRNIGTAPCRRIRLSAVRGARSRGSTDPFTLRPGTSASEEVMARVTGRPGLGRRVKMTFRARADEDVNAGNDAASVSALLVGVGDTDARVPRGHVTGFGGRARPGRGPVKPRRLRVERVDIAVRRMGGGCRWLASHAARFRDARAARGGRCNPAVWLRAEGTRSWRYSLARALPPGRYVLYTRATIAAGLREASFSPRDGNEITFTVP
jgi:hypothetical protein